jgi:uncharacterized hydrophobic protein (TIGR00341 family)
MNLRLLQLTLPGDRLDDLAEVAADLRLVDRWHLGPPEGRTLVHLLLEAEQVEAATDRLSERFGGMEGFRIVLLEVSATIPAVEEPEEEDDADAGPDPSSEEVISGTPGRISREELHADVSAASRLSTVYVVMVALSTVVAAGGLLAEDVAIVIGAMVIAPLLGPNIALSLAATLGDTRLARRSLGTIAAGVGVALGLSLALGAAVAVDPTSPGIAGRTSADLGDIAIALSAGAAGSLAFTSGVPAVVVGVMVAVALLPPLVTFGLLVGAGHVGLAGGAALLVATNIACINLAAVATFLIQKVEPRSWWEADRAKRATRIAVTTWLILVAGLAALIVLADI